MASFNVIPNTSLTPQFLKTTASSGGVRVNWIWMESAVKYVCDVYRSLTNQFSAAVKVGDTFANDFWVDLTAQSGTTYFYWIQGRRTDGVLSALVGPSSVTTGTIALADGGVTPQKLSTAVPVLSGGGSLQAYNLTYAYGGSTSASWSQGRAFVGGTGNSSVSLGSISPSGYFEATNWDTWYPVASQTNTGFSVASKVNIDLGVQMQFGAITAPVTAGEMGCYVRFLYVESGQSFNTPIFSYEWCVYRSIGGVVRFAQPILNWKFNSTGAYGNGGITYQAGKTYDFVLQILKKRESTALDMYLYNLGCYLDISYVPVTP